MGTDMHHLISSLERRTFRLVRSVQSDHAMRILEGAIQLVLKALGLEPGVSDALERSLVEAIHDYRKRKATLLEQVFRLMDGALPAHLISDGDDLFLLAERAYQNELLEVDRVLLAQVLDLQVDCATLNAELDRQIRHVVSEAQQGRRPSAI